MTRADLIADLAAVIADLTTVDPDTLTELLSDDGMGAFTRIHADINSEHAPVEPVNAEARLHAVIDAAA